MSDSHYEPITNAEGELCGYVQRPGPGPGLPLPLPERLAQLGSCGGAGGEASYASDGYAYWRRQYLKTGHPADLDLMLAHVTPATELPPIAPPAARENAGMSGALAFGWNTFLLTTLAMLVYVLLVWFGVL